MRLCIDIGNSQIFGGLFDGQELAFRFRRSSVHSSSDELGIFLKAVLRENKFDPMAIDSISICSVVPSLDYSIRSACIKYLFKEPFFLQAGVKTGLNIKYRHPVDVGADRIANAIGGIQQFPAQNLIILDFGTANTICVISKQKIYFGGAIFPGIRLSVEALSKNTAKLPSVEIIKVDDALGSSTISSIQSGIFFGAIGACREIIGRIKGSLFSGEPVIVLATGGFASLFDTENIYDHHLPDLVLQGLNFAYDLNH